MKYLIFALLAVASYVAAADIKTEEDVIVATVDNFKQVISENEFVLVEFCKYAYCICIEIPLNKSGVAAGLVAVVCGVIHENCVKATWSFLSQSQQDAMKQNMSAWQFGQQHLLDCCCLVACLPLAVEGGKRENRVFSIERKFICIVFCFFFLLILSFIAYR